LAPYTAAIHRVDGDVKALEAATADNPVQQAWMKRLRDLSAARLARMEQTIALYRSGDHAGATARQQLAPGKALTDQIRDVVAAMQAEASGLLQSRERAAVLRTDLAQAGLFGSGIVIFALIFITFRQGSARLALAVSSAAELSLANVALGSGLNWGPPS
jgi:CHASE3 domain sensor protein